ncbi:MAG: class I SAM-dependent methyltransferase [Elusimicrobiota bacterium]
MKKFFSPFKARRLNRKAAASRNMSKEIVKELSLLPGWNIADIGAGGGYYSFRFAGEVQRGGKVYAVDTNLDFLKYIAGMLKEKSSISIPLPPL